MPSLVRPEAGTVIDPLHATEYQSKGIPRPGELRVHRMSIVGSMRTRRGRPVIAGLSQYSPRSPWIVRPLSCVHNADIGIVTYARVSRPGPVANVTCRACA